MNLLMMIGVIRPGTEINRADQLIVSNSLTHSLLYILYNVIKATITHRTHSTTIASTAKISFFTRLS
jgi:hypothetical protein